MANQEFHREEEVIEVSVGILETEWKAILWMDTISCIIADITDQPELLWAMDEICSLLDRIYDIAGSKFIMQEELQHS